MGQRMMGVDTSRIYDDFLFYQDTNLRIDVGVRFNDLVIEWEADLSLRNVGQRLNYAPPLKMLFFLSFQLPP